MPELPEVETVATGLAAVLLHRRFVRVECRRLDLRRPIPAHFADSVTGRQILAVGRRAKYLQIHLAPASDQSHAVFAPDAVTILGHLGMSGRMLIDRGRNTPPEKHDHVLFYTDDGTCITFRDPRRFGFLDVYATSETAIHPLLRALGPEPMQSDFTPDYLVQALAGRKSPIKTALLDQTVLAGLGNIYVSESLFLSGISPIRPALSLSVQECHALHAAIRDVLARAIAAGGSSLKDHVQPNGELGYFQHSFAVYGRTGQPCPGCTCDTGITRLVQAGRSTFFCANKQR